MRELFSYAANLLNYCAVDSTKFSMSHWGACSAVSKKVVSAKSLAKNDQTYCLYNKQICQNNFILYVPHAVNYFE